MSTADVRCELAAVKQGCREIVGPVIAATRAAIPRYSLEFPEASALFYGAAGAPFPVCRRTHSEDAHILIKMLDRIRYEFGRQTAKRPSACFLRAEAPTKPLRLMAASRRSAAAPIGNVWRRIRDAVRYVGVGILAPGLPSCSKCRKRRRDSFLGVCNEFWRAPPEAA
jgi:hypothetical protein